MKGRLGVSTQIFTAMTSVLVSASLAFAGDFPGARTYSQVIQTQEKVDELFEKGDYDRAFFIYRQELTPLGDKYAQYMVGYMTIVGKGTDKDIILGSAWYRLAAERGEKNFAKARDEILAYFNDEQMAVSDERYAELRMQYSDAMIVAKLIEEDLEIISEQASNSSLSYSAVDSGSTNNSESRRRAESAADRIETRLGFLESSLISSEFMSAAERSHIEDLVRRTKIVIE